MEEGGRRKDKTAARAKDATRRFYSNCKHVEVELSERGLPEKLPRALFWSLTKLQLWYYRLLFYSINMITMSSNKTIYYRISYQRIPLNIFSVSSHRKLKLDKYYIIIKLY